MALALLTSLGPAIASPAAGITPGAAPAADPAGRGAWVQVMPADDTATATPDMATRRWTETAAWRSVAERLTLSIDRNPSVEGRRVLQVTIGLRLSF